MPAKKEMPDPFDTVTRRKFVYTLSTAVGTGLLLNTPMISAAARVNKGSTYTVGQIMELFIESVPGGAKKETVDSLKSGSVDIVVTGIVTAMFATIDVIRKAIDVGANFIIAHEPTFYNHLDDTDWLKDDDVYQYKANLLKQYNIAVWRNHDYIHTLVPDGVTDGVLTKLSWKQYADKAIPNIITLPPTTVGVAVAHIKSKLNIEKVRFIGDPLQLCTRVLLMPGAAGGRKQIESAGKVKPDLLLCGEVSEWETAEYIRDARAKGDKISLAILGHIASEEPGSEFMLNWLKAKVPGVKAVHMPSGNSYTFI